MYKEAFVLTGLHPEIRSKRLLANAEEMLTRGLGIDTTIVNLGWKKRKSLADLENNLDEKINKAKGRVVLIGVSAGMTEALLARQRHGADKISEIISICGWSWPDVGLDRIGLRKLNALRDPNPVFGEAIKKYTDLYIGKYNKDKFVGRFEEEDWWKILVFVAEKDQFVPRNCCVIGPVMDVVEMKGVDHIRGIAKALGETKVMRDFI